jgi:tripartite-type tricarboxylate transporter receptor subunit TctC
MISCTRAAKALLFAGIALCGDPVLSQNYPSRPVRIVTSEPGGSSDFVSRLIGQGISSALGQQVVVDNRAGIIAVQTVAKAAPDGHTLLLYGNVVWLEPLLRASAQWDATRDFAPVIMTNRAPNVIALHPSVPAGTLRQLIVLAQSRSGQLNYGAAAVGTSTHLAAELFKSLARVDIVRISYKSSGASLNALIGNEVQIMFPTAGSASTHVKAGRLKALAVTTREPSALAPGLPPAAVELPGFESEANYAIFAPAKTPPAIVRLLNQEVTRVLSKPDVREKFFNLGIEVVGGTPDQLAATMKSEVVRMGKVIKEAGIRADH